MASRVLVSNLGDGNWGVAGSASANSNLMDAAAAATATKSIYFPPALNADGTENKGVAPGPGSDNMSPASDLLGLVGWTSKTQWMVQVNAVNLGTGGTPNLVVSVVRPTGIEETVLTVTSTGEDSYGGFGDEAIVGPVSYFKFTSDSTGGAPNIRCYVIGWNYGDISDGLATP